MKSLVFMWRFGENIDYKEGECQAYKAQFICLQKKLSGCTSQACAVVITAEINSMKRGFFKSHQWVILACLDGLKDMKKILILAMLASGCTIHDNFNRCSVNYIDEVIALELLNKDPGNHKKYSIEDVYMQIDRVNCGYVVSYTFLPLTPEGTLVYIYDKNLQLVHSY